MIGENNNLEQIFSDSDSLGVNPPLPHTHPTMKATANTFESANLTPDLPQSNNLTAGIRKATAPIIVKLLLAAGVYKMATGLTGCTPTEKVDPKPIDPIKEDKLTPEQQKFADLLAPHADGTLKSITVDIGDPADPYFMPKMFRIEMELVNAKEGTYKITPWISKKPIEDALNKAFAAVPDQYGPQADIALVVKRADGTTYSPTSTFGIQLIDDKDPLTSEPMVSALPKEFTIDYLLKYAPSNTATMKKSYTLNIDQELQLWINTIAVGKQFAVVKLPIKPTEVLAVANQTGN